VAVRRRWAAVIFTAVALGAGACLESTNPGSAGRLLFRRDGATCTSPSTTELFVDGASLGQYVIAPGGQQGFEVSPGSHIARAAEVGTTGREFPAQAVLVPAGGSTVYLMACISSRPPDGT
jgi:hypothetical protein